MISINTDYTNLVQRRRANGEAQGILAITDDEFEWLFEHGADDDGSGIIALAEEAMLRTTGLRVDLSDQGPAHIAIVRDSGEPGNEHNTFMVSKSSRTSRVFDRDTPDSQTIPRVTPQDANWAMKSIDFPALRPKTLALDQTRITAKEGPSEVVFNNQITSAQVLDILRVDVSMLTTGINDEWGINYAERLVKEIALADIVDVSAYIASGGRPAPSIFMSPNITSSIKVVSSPTVDPRTVGYASAFTGRCKAMSKFVMASMQVLRGNGCSHFEKFNMNPAYFSKFNPKDLEGWAIEIPNRIELSPYASSIAQNGSFEEFVGSRIAVAVAVANDRTKVARVLNQMDKIATGSISSNLKKGLMSPSMALMAGRRVEGPPVATVVRDSDPSRLGAILYDVYNGTASGELFNSVLGSCAMTMVLASVTKKDLNLAEVWHDVKRSVGVGDALAHVNLSSIMRNQYLREIDIEGLGGDGKDAVGLVLLARHIDHVRDSVTAALFNACKKKSRRKKVKGFTGRVWKDFVGEITSFGAIKPFNHITRYRRLATITSTTSSLIAIDNRTASGFGSRDRLSDTVTVGSALRKHWATYYMKSASTWQAACYVAVKLSKDDSRKQRPVPVGAHGNEDWTGKAIQAARYASYCELVYNTALYLSYKWCAVVVGAESFSAMTSVSPVASAAFNTDKYIAALGRHAEAGIEPKVHVTIPTFTADGKAMSDKDFRSKVNYVLTPFYSGNAPSMDDLKLAAGDIVRAIEANTGRIAHTFVEAMQNDMREFADSTADADTAGNNDDLGDKADADFRAIDKVSREVAEEREAQNVASMLAHVPAAVTKAAMTRDAQAFKDIAYCAGSTVSDLDVEFSGAVMAMAENLTEEQYVAISTIVGPHIESMREIAVADDDVIMMILNGGLRDAMYDAASVCGVERTTKPLMR